jgi:starvation-inducible outer membrane lipoprotein
MRDLILTLLTLAFLASGCAAPREAIKPSSPAHRKTRLAALPLPPADRSPL